MSKVYLNSLMSLFLLGQVGMADVQVNDADIVGPVEDGLAAVAAAGAVEAIPMSQINLQILDTRPAASTQYQAVVKVENSSLEPDYSKPWLPGKFGGGRGTAFLIGENLFLTNAHVVSNAQQLYISKYGESRKLRAHVVHIAHDCDLALLKVDDYRPFEKMKPFKLGGLPRLEDEVRAIGYPIGGERLSVTRGVVSRIDTVNYAHSVADSHLIVQIDAAINPGNSGGPVLMGNDVVGVAFQGLSEADNTGYVIPVPVIQRFLKDIEDGKYDGYVSMGIMDFPILNPAMRTYLGLPDDEKGVLVGEIMKSGPAADVLKPGDVILEIDGHEVDSSGMIQIDGETVGMNELAERKFAGEEIRISYMREKEKKECIIKVGPIKSRNILAAQYDKKPRYIVFGGLLFQPGDRNTILAHKLQFPELNPEVEEFVLGGGNGNRQDFVLLTDILPDEINEHFGGVKSGIVTKVNGTEVQGLSHMYQLLHPEENPEYFVIELKGLERPIVLENAVIHEANERIAKQYNVLKEAHLD